MVFPLFEKVLKSARPVIIDKLKPFCPIVKALSHRTLKLLHILISIADKDLAAAILAKSLDADAFIISTAVDKVCLDYRKPTERKIDSMTVAEAEGYAAEGQFPAGSMLPKVQAVSDYVRTTGGLGIITDPAHLSEAVSGEGGTKIVP